MDTESIMCHDSAGLIGFTPGDLAAIQVLYGTPIWSQEITGPATYPSANPATYTLNFETNLIGGYTVSWYVGSALKQTGTATSFTPTSLISGPYTVKAVISCRGTNYEASKSIYVVPEAPNFPVLSIDRTLEGPGWYIIFNVSNSQPGATYEWDVIQGETMWASSNFIYVYCPEEQFEGPYGPYLIVRCRATINGTTSEWSPAYYVLLNYFVNANSAGQLIDAEGVPLDLNVMSLDIGDGILLR